MTETNKRLQQQLSERPVTVLAGARVSGEQSPTAASPASSAVGATEKVSYVKFAQLRAEKRQVEARLTAQIDELKSEITKTVAEKDAESEKLREHNRRVVSDLERKTRLAQQSKSEDSKELRELRPLYEKLLNEKSQMEVLNFEYKRRIDELESDLKARESELNELVESEKFLSLELEEREKVIAQMEVRGSKSDSLSAELTKVKEERLDLLEKIEEREDMLNSVQEEARESKKKLTELESLLARKETEIKAMLNQADELDSLLSRADQDVSSSRLRIQALTAELDLLRSSNKDKQFESEISRREATIQALTVDLTQARSEKDQLKNRLESVLDERDRLTVRVEELLAKPVCTPKKEVALVDAEAKINQLERELDSMREAIETAQQPVDDSIIAAREDMLTENVGRAEHLFHQAVDKCTDAEFGEAVVLLEKAAKTLASLSRAETDMNDSDMLRILESDIYGQLGVAYQSLSQVPEAIQAYTTAVDVDPEAHACHANLAVLLQHQSRLKEAEDHALRAAELAPDIEEYTDLVEQIRSYGGQSDGLLFRHSTRW
jgi:tetratricopeptide (TPR) repeat protein